MTNRIRVHSEWYQDDWDKEPRTPISVRKVGYAGLVRDKDRDEEFREMVGHKKDQFDEDLYDDVTPEPTSKERNHFDRHDEFPDSYHNRHWDRYHKALAEKEHENTPDFDDPTLHRFVQNWGAETDAWRRMGHLGMVDIKHRPVYATQSHVAQEHLDRYHQEPNDISNSIRVFGHRDQFDKYLGDDHPLFVTHEGRLHVIEGHHRVGAALQQGAHQITGWHFDLDKYPEYGIDDDDRFDD